MRLQDTREPADDRKTGRAAVRPAVTDAGLRKPDVPIYPRTVAALQRTVGNAAVTRMIRGTRQPDPLEEPGDPRVTGVPPVQRSTVDSVLRSAGRPLAAPLRAEMETRMNADFADVRDHTDTAAQRLAAELGACAYTSGHHIVPGRNGADKHTLADELTHVVQQRSGPVAGTDTGAGLKVSDPSDRIERAAEENARQVMSGPLTAAPTSGGPHSGSAGESFIQRTLWKFNASTMTHSYTGQQSPGLWQATGFPPASWADLGLPVGRAAHGDIYDDQTGQMSSSANASIRKRGTVNDQDFAVRNNRIRHALVEAKGRINAALQEIRAASTGHPSPRLEHALKLSFPVFQEDPPRRYRIQFLNRIYEVIALIRDGLNAEGAEFTVAGSPGWHDYWALNADASNAVAWVDPTPGELANRLIDPNRLERDSIEPLFARHGAINLFPQGEVPWFIIHEATHRFAGTLDYQYSSYAQEITEDDLAAAGIPLPLGTIENRRVRSADQYTGQGKYQQNWYAMGRRALMNADSYAQLVMTVTGERLPRLPH